MANNLEITSPAFPFGQAIPSKYTCDGANVSPPLEWTQPPSGTKSLVLIVDDPDAPRGTWVHWVLYDIPVSARGLAESASADRALPPGTQEGANDFQQTPYGGPCPPSGADRYFFRLYALDAPLSLPAGASRAEVDRAMAGHVLAQAELMGTYRRSRR